MCIYIYALYNIYYHIPYVLHIGVVYHDLCLIVGQRCHTVYYTLEELHLQQHSQAAAVSANNHAVLIQSFVDSYRTLRGQAYTVEEIMLRTVLHSGNVSIPLAKAN
jgi:hypothetical protein